MAIVQSHSDPGQQLARTPIVCSVPIYKIIVMFIVQISHDLELLEICGPVALGKSKFTDNFAR